MRRNGEKRTYPAHDAVVRARERLMLHAKTTLDGGLLAATRAILEFRPCARLEGKTLATLRSIAKGFSKSKYEEELTAIRKLQIKRGREQNGVTGLCGKRDAGVLRAPDTQLGGLVNLREVVRASVPKHIAVSEVIRRAVTAEKEREPPVEEDIEDVESAYVYLAIRVDLRKIGGKVSIHVESNGNRLEHFGVLP